MGKIVKAWISSNALAWAFILVGLFPFSIMSLNLG
jgi:hypothetical protein